MAVASTSGVHECFVVLRLERTGSTSVNDLVSTQRQFSVPVNGIHEPASIIIRGE